jgi:hypothetical protein
MKTITVDREIIVSRSTYWLVTSALNVLSVYCFTILSRSIVRILLYRQKYMKPKSIWMNEDPRTQHPLSVISKVFYRFSSFLSLLPTKASFQLLLDSFILFLEGLYFHVSICCLRQFYTRGPSTSLYF